MVQVAQTAEAIVEASRWVLKPDAFGQARADAGGLSQKALALSMGFGRGDDRHAQSTLSVLLRHGRPTSGTRVVRAASVLGANPYVIARPLEAFDTDVLRRAVEICLDEPAATRRRQHAVILASADLLNSGVDASFDKLERDLTNVVVHGLHMVRPVPVAKAVADDAEAEAGVGAALAREGVVQFIRALNAYTLREAYRSTGDKYAVDITGLQTDFTCWARPEYNSVVAVDRRFAEARAVNRRRRVIRAFAVDPKILSRASVDRLRRTMLHQIQAGVEVRVKLVGPSGVDREHLSDIGLLGDYAVDAGELESLIDGQRFVPIAEMFVPANDATRFKRIARRVEWVRDDREAFAIATRPEELNEIMKDVALRCANAVGPP